MKRFLKTLLRLVFSRTFIIFVAFVAQVAAIGVGIFYLRRYVGVLYGIMMALGVIVMVYLLNKDELPEFKLVWAIPICTIPVFGAIFFLTVDKNFGAVRVRRRMNEIAAATAQFMVEDESVTSSISAEDPAAGQLATYLASYGYPPCIGATCTYFPIGEDKWADVLEELERAERYIFLEYFIINAGQMWDPILEILKRKAASGVDVRFMYDGTCSVFRLPHNYPKQLERFGIHTRVFSPLVPAFSTHQNNRDHRKILVIDGRVAYTGGINFADEYINIGSRFGHWKDVSIKVTGEAVGRFTVMFLRTWDLLTNAPHPGNSYSLYISPVTPHSLDAAKSGAVADTSGGFVIPYADGPNVRENVAEKVYMHILNTARTYVHIMTPYFIIDDAMVQSILFAAGRGVDVEIILPHIPDKAYAFAIARRYYPMLLKAGVRVYEYEPGFVHAKVFVSDDICGVVGSINLDYRSLYHHFECAAYIYDNPVIADIEADFIATRARCIEVTQEYYDSISIWQKILGDVCNLLAPLL